MPEPSSPSRPLALVFVRGHRHVGRIGEFPHYCPGEGCAIAAWLAQNASRTCDVGPGRAIAGGGADA